MLLLRAGEEAAIYVEFFALLSPASICLPTDLKYQSEVVQFNFFRVFFFFFFLFKENKIKRKLRERNESGDNSTKNTMLYFVAVFILGRVKIVDIRAICDEFPDGLGSNFKLGKRV